MFSNLKGITKVENSAANAINYKDIVIWGMISAMTLENFIQP